MSSELDFLRSLEDEPRSPSTVDIQRAIADGRRSRRNRRRLGYAGTAVLTALVVAGGWAGSGLVTHARAQAGAQATAAGAPSAEPSAGPPPPASCTLSRLPAPDDAPMALVAGADPTGRYIVGRSYPKAGGYQAVIWHDGKGMDVMLPGDLEEDLEDVNSSGTAVGWSFAPDGPIPYVYRNGKVSTLPGVRRGSANAINEAGAIVGDDHAGAALLWPSATAQPTRLPVPASASGAVARDIDEDGTVVGDIFVQTPRSKRSSLPYVWRPDGTHRQLPLPKLDSELATSASVVSVRNGWATGWAYGSTAVQWGVQWNLRTGEVRTVPGLATGNAVNPQGWVAGVDRQWHAVLVAGGTHLTLPDLASNPTGQLSTIASTVSDDGRTIAGQSDDAQGVIQAVVWHCS